MSSHNAGRVLAALQRPGAFWFDDLAPVLAQFRWSKLHADCGVDGGNYGTARVLDCNPVAERNVIGYLQGPIPKGENRIAIECLPANVTKRYHDFGLNFYSPDEILGSNLINILDRAFHVISSVRGAARTVSTITAIVHILKPDSSDYDVSYSEPRLPFSIFVGIDARWQVNLDLRVAESILHECMHLQLTLIEDQISLLVADNEHHFSPWRRALRPTRGVLHALYVFRVIQDFFTAVIASNHLSEAENSHVSRRLRDIDAEVELLGDLSASQDLTPAGRAFVVRLQAGNRLV